MVEAAGAIVGRCIDLDTEVVIEVGVHCCTLHQASRAGHDYCLLSWQGSTTEARIRSNAVMLSADQTVHHSSCCLWAILLIASLHSTERTAGCGAEQAHDRRQQERQEHGLHVACAARQRHFCAADVGTGCHPPFFAVRHMNAVAGPSAASPQPSRVARSSPRCTTICTLVIRLSRDPP